MTHLRIAAIIISWLTLGAPALASSLSLYISKSGVDTGNCHAMSAPCLTINYAVNNGVNYVGAHENLVVNFLGSGTWAESFMASGPIPNGLHTLPIPNIGTIWPSMVILKGNGSTNTTISGDGSVCYTIASSEYATVGVSSIRITGNALGCQSSLFAQLGGSINVFDGVDFGPASAAQVHAEDSGSSIQFWQDYKISGGAESFIAVGSQANVKVSAGVGTLQGNPAYTTSFIFGYANGNVQTNIPSPWAGAATGTKFFLQSNATIETNGSTSSSLVPGNSPGSVSSGARYHGPMQSGILSTSGLGTGGASVNSSSTPVAGQVILAPSGTPAGGGTVNVLMPYRVVMSDGSPASCVVTASQAGTAGWNTGTFMTADLIGGTTPYLRINWVNGYGPWPLASGYTYQINYKCDGD